MKYSSKLVWGKYIFAATYLQFSCTCSCCGTRLIGAYKRQKVGVLTEETLILNFYRTQVSLGSDLWVLISLTHSLTTRLCADLTDVTLADEESNPIPTNDVNRAILGNVAMQVAPPGGQN